MSLRSGDYGESLAARYLQQQGLEIIARKVRYRVGELDLICQDGDACVFIEVKARQSDAFGGPLAAVTAAKQNRLRRAAACYLQHAQQTNRNCRFDVVGVHLVTGHITWIQDAF
jgi:putative endonuclease